MDDAAASLAGVTPFADFAPEELAELLRQTQQRAYRADDVVFREGDPPAFVYYVVGGEVVLTLTSGDRRINVGRFTAGRLLGIQSLFDPGPQFVSAVTVIPTRLLAIPREPLLAVLRRHPDSIVRLAAVFARQIRWAALMVAEMQFLELPVRLAMRILDLAEAPVARRDSAGQITVKVTQRELSELTGATRVGVNRALKRLEHLGVIRLQRGRLTILDPQHLREMARHEPLPMILGIASGAPV